MIWRSSDFPLNTIVDPETMQHTISLNTFDAQLTTRYSFPASTLAVTTYWALLPALPEPPTDDVSLTSFPPVSRAIRSISLNTADTE